MDDDDRADVAFVTDRTTRVFPHLRDGALDRASTLVVSTPWPEFREVSAAEVTARMARPLVLDVNRFTGETLGTTVGIEYVSVGRSVCR